MIFLRTKTHPAVKHI